MVYSGNPHFYAEWIDPTTSTQKPHYYVTTVPEGSTQKPHHYVQAVLAGDTHLPRYRFAKATTPHLPHWYVQVINGTELLSNPGFGTDTIWTKGGGWTIGSGVATRTNVGGVTLLSQPVALVAGGIYLTTFTANSITSGSISASLTGGTNVIGIARTAAGTYTESLIALAGNVTFAMRASAPFAGSIDNVSLIRIG